jgi:hypothetical protein
LVGCGGRRRLTILSPETISGGRVDLTISLIRQYECKTYKTVGIDEGKDVKVVFVQIRLNIFIAVLEALDKLEGDVFEGLKVSDETQQDDVLTGPEIHSRA